MSKFEEMKKNVAVRGKSLLAAVADILESVTKQNIAFANEFAGFAVEQVRLPTQADGLADYRSRSKAAYAKLGTTLKHHGKDLIAVVREVPGQVKGALKAEAQAPTHAKKVAKKSTRKAKKLQGKAA
ncbi:MAG: hypothetical protein OER22_00860 [Gammaproteobacteria bacterium]|nr:hypothetical protein [Gammaproteobacteria bacterium]MDH3371876.1 hypothetical protein [Gammaproteobacteria bacterium]MDH3407795.1 hypothetical protein [Gammaproteobacteria bacterium]MDH3551142.1 hypothetical protein [Gammaproteobacteria bacterium]